MKICTKCKVKLPLLNFHRQRVSKDGHTTACKECTKKRHTGNYIVVNSKVCSKCKIKLPIYNFNKTKHNKDGHNSHCRSCVSKYHSDTKEERQKKQKEYRDSHREERKLYSIINKDSHNNYRRKKYNEDHLYRLTVKIRSSILSSRVKNNFYKSTKNILGCTWEEFKIHLENNKYNFKITNKNLDLDHIIPVSSAKTEEELIKLNHYSNFQLLPKVYNRDIKKNKPWNKVHFEKWLKDNTTKFVDESKTTKHK